MKRYLITGASRGIGRAIAKRLAADQTTLLLHGRDAAALEESCSIVLAKGGVAVPLRYDLADRSQIAQMIDAVAAEPLDALINNAGIAVVKPFTEVTIDEWEKTLRVNITAPFLLTQKLAPMMKPGASIVNILSIAAKTGFAGWSTYSMSKFALEGWSQSVREELREQQIRVINIYPAATDTEIWNSVEGEWPRDQMMPASEIAEAVAFALARPAGVGAENISLSSVTGRL
jgi:L-xylulose reductase